MKFLRTIQKVFESIGKARAAAELTRLGRHDLALLILKNE